MVTEDKWKQETKITKLKELENENKTN